MPTLCGSRLRCSSAALASDQRRLRLRTQMDGFRALVSRNGDLRVKSRRGWDTTSLVPELAQ